MTHGERRKKKKRKTRRKKKKKKVWRGEKEEKGKKKKMREVIMMMVSAGVERRKKKTERYLVYWGLFYFGAIFELKLSCHLEIGCYKSWVLQPISIEVKFLIKSSMIILRATSLLKLNCKTRIA
jgi:hypothetical protein